MDTKPELDLNRDLNRLRHEIDALDCEIVRLILRRTDVSRQVGRIRKESGGPKVVYHRELEIYARYGSSLGKEGNELADILLRLGRGHLGQP